MTIAIPLFLEELRFAKACNDNSYDPDLAKV